MTASRLNAMLVLAAAGLASAVFGVCFILFTLYAAGAWFGAASAISLRKLRVFNNDQSGQLVLVSIVAYLLSAELFWKADRTSFSPVTAGALGGFVLIGGATWLAHQRHGAPPRFLALSWARCAAPSLPVWGARSGLRSAEDSILPSAPPWNPSPIPEMLEWYSIFLVWQTGMGLMLGLVLGGRAGPAQEHRQK